MKIIFDFDDTLFDSQAFKRFIYGALEEKGVSREISEGFYKEVRDEDTPFSLKDFLAVMATRAHLDIETTGALYEQIMESCPQFVRPSLIDIVKEIGKSDCYIVTNGDDEFQRAKIEKSGITSLFCEIYTTPGTKRDIIKDICTRHKDEKIFFLDDKVKFFEDLDRNTCTNLTTILYDEHGLEHFLETLKQN